MIYEARVKIRPGAEYFLERMAQKYELVIFTASLPEVCCYAALLN